MHAEMEHFFAVLRDKFPAFFSGVSVLEIGSYDINGSIRKFFKEPREYVGVDLVPGPGVDVVAHGEALALARHFDVVVSTECFEHNPNYRETFANMVRHARPGGLVTFTCASTGRAEHGTSRTSPEFSPGTVGTGWEHYRNLEARDFGFFPFSEAFVASRFYYNHLGNDLYFAGVTKSEAPTDCRDALTEIGESILAAHPRVVRTALCPCGSGQRYKYCHGRK